jgi:hypothetical protein
MNPALISVALEEAPEVIAWLREAFRKRQPGAPEPTEAEVIAAYQLAFTASLAKDEAWLTAHPGS